MENRESDEERFWHPTKSVNVSEYFYSYYWVIMIIILLIYVLSAHKLPENYRHCRLIFLHRRLHSHSCRYHIP